MFFTPTPPPVTMSGNQYAETISAFSNMSIGMAALFVLGLFVLAVIVYFYSNRNKGQGENTVLQTFAQAMGSTLKERDERIDTLEAGEAKREQMQNEGLMAVGDGLNRIADLWTAAQKREAERDRILSDLAMSTTAIATAGSKPLQQVVKDVGVIKDTSDEIQKVVKGLFDAYALNFPTKKPIDELFEELRKAILEAIEKKCEEKITHELPAVNVVTVTTNAPAESDKPATADGEAA